MEGACFRVADRPELGGKAAVATRRIRAGEVVLCEKPLHLWPVSVDALDAAARALHERIVQAWPEGDMGLAASGGDLAGRTRLAVHMVARCGLPDDVLAQLDNFSRPTEFGGLDVQPLRVSVQIVAARVDEVRAVGAEAMLEWLLVVMTNSHSFAGQRAALHCTGSKFAHGCNPHVHYVSSEENGLVYRAVRDIADGQVIFFSYLGERDLWASTARRQAVLRSSKLFRCACERCATDADFLRPLPCPSCGQSRQMHSELRGVWACTGCSAEYADGDAAMQPFLDDERRLVDDVLYIGAQLHALDAGMAQTLLLGFVMQATREIGDGHWIVAAAHRALCELFFRLRVQLGDGDDAFFLTQAAKHAFTAFSFGARHVAAACPAAMVAYAPFAFGVLALAGREADARAVLAHYPTVEAAVGQPGADADEDDEVLVMSRAYHAAVSSTPASSEATTEGERGTAGGT